jgi:CBS domain containing-hemolysin-like protein
VRRKNQYWLCFGVALVCTVVSYFLLIQDFMRSAGSSLGPVEEMFSGLHLILGILVPGALAPNNIPLVILVLVPIIGWNSLVYYGLLRLVARITRPWRKGRNRTLSDLEKDAE